jgi:hypothetical protein
VVEQLTTAVEQLQKALAPADIKHFNHINLIQELQEILSNMVGDQLGQLSTAVEQLQEALAPSDIKHFNQRCWLLQQQKGDLLHRLDLRYGYSLYLLLSSQQNRIAADPHQRRINQGRRKYVLEIMTYRYM